MNIKRKAGEPVEITLTKSEAARVLEAAYIIDGIVKNLTEDDRHYVSRLLSTRERLRQLAREFGAKHLNDDGTLKQSEKRQAVDASAPTPPAPATTA